MDTINTSISAITIYPDRARVTRRGTLKLEVGPHAIEIDKLPLQLIPDSLRATARGTARARLHSVQAKRIFYQEAPLENVRQLERQIEDIQDEKTRLDDQIALVTRNRNALDAVAGHSKVYAKALATGKTSVEAQLTLFDGLRERAEKLDDELATLIVEQRNKDKSLQKLKQELEQLRSARPRERYTAIIEVEVLQAGDLTVDLSYVVSKAGWKPLYDIRLIDQEGEAELEIGYLAEVTQKTGESWEGVALTISTARPALSGTLPELDPWYIAPPRPRGEPVRREKGIMRAAAVAPAAAESESDAADRVFAKEMAQGYAAEVVTASVSASGPAVTYQISKPTTIPPDGAPHKVAIANFPLKPELDYVITPKLVEVAYRRAQVVNNSAYTLLGGSANLFVADEFIGSTQLDLTPPQGEIELYLGTDDRIKVTRKLKRRDVDKRFIGGKRRQSFGYEIELENLLTEKAEINLHDQIPTPIHEDIKVKLESADPEPSKQSELNLLDWNFSLESKKKKLLRFDFSVEYPQEMQVLGLP